MEDYRNVTHIIAKLIGLGLIERTDGKIVLTPKGRHDAFLRWRGLEDDARILFRLMLQDNLVEQKGGD